LKFEHLLGGKDTALIIRGSDTLSKALAIILIHLRKVRKYSSSNPCLPLPYIVTFPGLIWCPNSDMLLLEI